MDWLQGPINPSCFFGEHFEEQGQTRFGEEEEEEEELEAKMPFLHMLQSFETPSFLPLMKEPSFQTLLRLQHLKKTTNDNNNNNNNNNNDLSHEIMETQIQALDFESYGVDSPVKSEVKDQPEPAEEEEEETRNAKTTREKRKRKRTRPTKNQEEVESQRMTHIAVERNRRRQMNDHLNVLRSLMPKTYIQRGDQASIVGGAIDFVKELEQLAQSLEAQKRMIRRSTQENSSLSSSSNSCNSSSTISSSSSLSKTESAANIEATVIQTHVNLKVEYPKRPGQLLKAIIALEELRLTVLHLNITSSDDAVLYSFNLKIEDGCKLRSADEISGAVHQIFRNIIDGS